MKLMYREALRRVWSSRMLIPACSNYQFNGGLLFNGLFHHDKSSSRSKALNTPNEKRKTILQQLVASIREPKQKISTAKTYTM